MVLTKKFSEFSVASLNNADTEIVGLENGANIRSDRFLSWTTATRPASPFNGLLGLNTDLEQYEWYDADLLTWVQLQDSGDINGLIARLAAHTMGDGASMIGLLDQSNVTNKTVQDLADATFIAQTDNGTLQNAQFLGDLTTGIVKNTTGTGVLSISAPLTSIDSLTTVANNLIFTTAPNVYSVIAPANNSILATDVSGTPAWTLTLPLAVQSNITQLGAQSQTLNMNSHLINNVTDPVSAQDAATKHYVDQVALTGTSVLAATTANLNVTQSGAGVGATLTDASGTFASLSLDGISISVGDYVLVKDQTLSQHDGIYQLTTQGNGVSIPYVLTRSTRYDTPTEINTTGLIVVRDGTTQADTVWYNTDTIVTVDTTPFNFVQFGSQSEILQEISTNGNIPQNNFIYGGNFDTNPFQRGTSFATAANGTWAADRFRWLFVGAGVATVGRATDSPSVLQAGILVQNCLSMQVTTADGTIAATDTYRFQYRMEGYDWAQLAQRPFVISFLVRSSVTGIYSLSVQNQADRSYVAEYTINAANTWEFKQIAISASPSAGTWGYTNGLGLIINFIIAAGTNFQTSSLNTWNSDFLAASTNQVNGMSTIGNLFRLSLVKIEPGTVATPWQIRTEQQELSLCQRYFEKTFNASVAPAVAGGSGGSITYTRTSSGATSSGTQWRFKQKKRATPTVTYYGLATTTLWRNLTAGADSGASSSLILGEDSIHNINDGTAGDAANSSYGIHATADAEL